MTNEELAELKRLDAASFWTVEDMPGIRSGFRKLIAEVERLKEVESDYAEFETEHDYLWKDYQQKEKDIAHLQDELRSYKRTADRMSGEISELCKKIECLQEDCTHHKEKLTEAKTEIDFATSKSQMKRQLFEEQSRELAEAAYEHET